MSRQFHHRSKTKPQGLGPCEAPPGPGTGACFSRHTPLLWEEDTAHASSLVGLNPSLLPRRFKF